MVSVKVQRMDRPEGRSVYNVVIPTEIIEDSGVGKGDSMTVTVSHRGVIKFTKEV